MEGREGRRDGCRYQNFQQVVGWSFEVILSATISARIWKEFLDPNGPVVHFLPIGASFSFCKSKFAFRGSLLAKLAFTLFCLSSVIHFASHLAVRTWHGNQHVRGSIFRQKIVRSVDFVASQISSIFQLALIALQGRLPRLSEMAAIFWVDKEEDLMIFRLDSQECGFDFNNDPVPVEIGSAFNSWFPPILCSVPVLSTASRVKSEADAKIVRCFTSSERWVKTRSARALVSVQIYWTEIALEVFMTA